MRRDKSAQLERSVMVHGLWSVALRFKRECTSSRRYRPSLIVMTNGFLVLDRRNPDLCRKRRQRMSSTLKKCSIKLKMLSIDITHGLIVAISTWRNTVKIEATNA